MVRRDPLESARSPSRTKTASKRVSLPDSTPFEGFPREGRTFFRELSKNQDREWFQQNKPRYEALWEQPLKALVREVARKLSGTFPDLEDPKPKIFRLYRDTRFSADKTPFKTHAAAVLPLFGGSPMEGTGLYLHFGADESFVVAGRWRMDKASLEHFRAFVADDESGERGEELLKKAERAGFSAGAHESLKRVPPPYPADHVRAEMLKRKGLALTFPPLDAQTMSSKELASWVSTHAKKLAPLLEWIEEACA